MRIAVVLTTPAPILGEQAGGEIIATKTTTREDGVVVEVFVEEVEVYVTVDAPQPARRHVHHKHLRRDREHGMLRR